MTKFDDGSGPALFVGGAFSFAGGASANRIAKWNGSGWSALGSGVSANWVYALASFDDGTGPALYAGGDFTTAGAMPASRVARWNGSAWSPLSGTVDGPVYTLTVFDDGSGPALYIGGNFGLAGGVAVNRVGRWNGTSWSALGSGVAGGPVRAFASFDDGSGPVLVAGGEFTSAGGVSAGRVAQWNGSSWSAVGAGVNGAVHALTAFDDGSGSALYAAGAFTSAVESPASRIARWNGTAWLELAASPMPGLILALAVFEDGTDGAADLVAGGVFSVAGGNASRNIAAWRGCPPGEAYCFGDGIDPLVTAQCPCGNFGDPGHGCGNSVFASGARLIASGTKSPNTILFTLTNVPNNALATGFRNTTNNPTGAVFGDGVRCQTGSLLRFGTHSTGTAGDAPNTWTAGIETVTSGLTRYYVVQYRNSSGFCPPKTFNISNAYRVTW